MSRAASLLFAIFCYAIFFATFLYLIIFVGDLNVAPFAPFTVDRGPTVPVASAVVIDVALIALWGVQHSVMARQGFKRAWTKFVPRYLERSVYVLASSITLMIIFFFWRPIPATVWSVSSPLAHDILFVLFWLGWGTILISTFLINHFELFGLQQAWCHMRGSEFTPPRFRTPFLYKFVRHPMMVGFFFAFWASPQMTAGHLLLAIGMSAYILIALRYEERDLLAYLGRDYEDYRGRVGMLIPRLRNRA